MLTIMRDRKEKLTLCVYCGLGDEAGAMSKEHIVPKSLWAKKPSDLMTVPAHIICNNAFSADNEYFRTVIANNGHDRGSTNAASVTMGPVSRSMLKRPKQFLAMTKDWAVRPRFTPTGLFLGHQQSFSIDYQIINRVLQNIVRCLFYDLTGSRLDDSAQIDVYECDDDNYNSTTQYFVDHMCEWQSIGGGVFCVKYGFREGFDDICCLMRFFGVSTYFATTVTTGTEPVSNGQTAG